MSLNVKISGTETCPECGHVFTVGGKPPPPKKSNKPKFSQSKTGRLILLLLALALIYWGLSGIYKDLPKPTKQEMLNSNRPSR